MSTNLVVLAVLMLLVTYPSRAVGLLTPGLDRLPKIAFDYLQLVGPAVLAALATVRGIGVGGGDGRRHGRGRRRRRAVLPRRHRMGRGAGRAGDRRLAAEPVPGAGRGSR